MPSGWGPTQKKCQSSREKAVHRLIAMFPSDYLKVLDEERAVLGLPPLNDYARAQIAPGCGVYNHARDCTCDLSERIREIGSG
jgi:hypothetical protein